MTVINPAIITALHQGAVIGYPTEAVFGLGCDPDNRAAVEKILAIKQRSVAKGLILIAANYEQLKPYIDDSGLSQQQQQAMHANWPGPFSYVIPAKSTTAKWLTGDFNSLAVRVSAHPVVQQLCLDFNKPLVSTSANLAGQPAITDAATLGAQLGDQLEYIVPGQPNPDLQPSTIIDALSGTIYR